MSPEFESIFVRLRAILQKHAGTLSVKDNTPQRYCLEGSAGPAALRAWGGKVKRPMIPVAWVQIGKAYVSYHLMGVYGNAKLCDGMSKELKARMQGKTCFNFKQVVRCDRRSAGIRGVMRVGPAPVGPKSSAYYVIDNRLTGLGSPPLG